jgi:para-nitrobenzyl esterase
MGNRWQSPDRRDFLKASLAGGALLSVPAARAGSGLPGAALATTTHGKVRGTVEFETNVFRGIRYGADTAKHRFQPPVPPQPWARIVDAMTYGPASPQGNANEKPQSEDCLFLNVWTPGLRDGAKRPVMVYIHGGAYSNGSGSSPLYDGGRLARRGDVVVVTLNHRLNAFGYLYLKPYGEPFLDSGNAGQLDLVLALEWVRDNIAEFGGDPSRVMVFGQSGGGAKIATLMAMPRAKGLFHRAATMSGQQVTASGPLHAEARTDAFLAGLKLGKNDIPKLLDLPTESLVAALKATDPIIGSGGVYMGPVLDERTLTRHPFYPDAPALSSNVPMIIGNTHDETRLLIGGQDPSAFSLSWDQLPPRLATAMRVDIDPSLVVAEYRRLYPKYSASDVFFSATTAARSWRGAIIEAELRAEAGTPVFAYELDWPSPIDAGKWRAPHTLDIPLVFDNVDVPGALSGNGDGARAMANQICEAFIAFARSGYPNCSAIPKWTPYTLPNRETMLFDLPSRMANDPRGDERRLFAKVPYIQQGT